jgi:hypothetical protein
MGEPQKLDLARVALYLVILANRTHVVPRRPDYVTLRGTAAGELKACLAFRSGAPRE